MLSILARPLTAWNRRWARPKPAAAAAVGNLAPATIVTGASRGIGRALAREFARGGGTVVLVARGKEALDEAARDISRIAKEHVFTLAMDVTAPEAPRILDEFLAANGLYANVLVNNAGIGLGGRFDAHAPDEVADLVALNVAALTRLMRHVLPGMRDRAEGGVLNVASLGGYSPGPYQAAYYASKAYVASLTVAVAHEMAGEGVRMSVLAPGPVETRFHANMGANDAFYRWLVPAMTPERVAKAGVDGFRLWRRVVIPGFIPSIFSVALKVLPHAVVVPMVGWLLAPRGRIKKDTML